MTFAMERSNPMTKKEAGGPFRKEDTHGDAMLMVGNLRICNWSSSYQFTDTIENALKSWLKSPAERAWMRKEKIG